MTQFCFSQVAVIRIENKEDSLWTTENFTIYKSDTFNVKDINGLIQGKGIYFIKDSIIKKGVTSYALGYHNGSKVASCVFNEEPTEIQYFIKNVFYGRYLDNQKIGLWICYWGNGKKRVEMSYEKGKPIDQVNIYYETGELMYHGKIIAGNNFINLEKYLRNGTITEKIEWWLSEISELSN